MAAPGILLGLGSLGSGLSGGDLLDELVDAAGALVDENGVGGLGLAAARAREVLALGVVLDGLLLERILLESVFCTLVF